MKNIIKTVIVMLTSISLFGSANAGELTVSGTAKATYNITSGYSNQGKGLGVTNEFDLGANGELDNGFTWKYQIQMDPGNSGATNNSDVQNDDSQLTLTTPYGTAGVFISEGGLDVEDSASQSVYGRPTDIGDPSATVDNMDIDGNNSLQYHTPAGLLPFDTIIKLATVPNAGGSSNTSGNATGGVTTSVTTTVAETYNAAQIKATPMPGLNVGASYVQANNGGTSRYQAGRSGAVFAKYKTGPYSVGISRAEFHPHVATLTPVPTRAASIERYGQTNVSAAYLVNDNLSVSYEVETSLAYRVSDMDDKQESQAIQAAYTMGGMTLAISQGYYDNIGYSANKDAEQTLFAVTMAF